jgi:hypothetical protein
MSAVRFIGMSGGTPLVVNKGGSIADFAVGNCSNGMALRIILSSLWSRRRMAERRLKRPRDPIQLGKLIVDIATGQVEDRVEDGKDPAAVELGRRGGVKDGKARSARLSADQRRESASPAARVRWGRKKIRHLNHLWC